MRSVRSPVRVRYALVALWMAWLVSAIALFVNQFLNHESGIGPGLSTGGISLCVQAIALISIGRGSAFGRSVAVVFLLPSAISLSILGRLIAEHSFVSAAYTVVGFALKAIGVYLLFTGESRTWFARNS